MSQPKRYEHGADGYVGWLIDPTNGKRAPFGDYVLSSDYAALAAELEKWREEHNQLVYENKVTFPTRIGVLQKGLADAAAENERLRYIGFKMRDMIGDHAWTLAWDAECKYSPFAAKEGGDAK